MTAVNPDPLAEALAGKPAPKRARKPRARNADKKPKPSSVEAVMADWQRPWRNPLCMGIAHAPLPTGALARTVKRLEAVAADHGIRVYNSAHASAKPVLFKTCSARNLGWLDRMLTLPASMSAGYRAGWIAKYLGHEFYGPEGGANFASALVAAVYAAELARAPRPGRVRARTGGELPRRGRLRARLPR